MRLSAVAYFADFFLAGAIVLALCAWIAFVAIQPGNAMLLPIWLGAALAGLSVWSLAEYAIHRFMYHHVPPFEQLHDAHHAEPAEMIGAPPAIGVVIILAFGCLPLLVFDGTVAGGFSCGLLVGYLGYMLVHHAAHHWQAAPGTWLYGLRRHHALHHYRSDEGNFGIITSFWDRVFGTALDTAAGRKNRPAD